MKTLLICLALFIGQMNTLQDKPVVHLQAHHNSIQVEFGGKLLELVNAPTVITLPATLPKLDSQGAPWSIDIKNLGPGSVTVVGKSRFGVQISVGQTVRINSSGSEYSVKR
jgi:hypothetical protein